MTSKDTVAEDRDRLRVSKSEFISRVAKRTSLPVKTTASVYEAMVDELLTVVKQGGGVTLTGFGRFYAQEHKGHRVQFVEGETDRVIDDYTVLKFSATREVNRQLDE